MYQSEKKISVITPFHNIDHEVFRRTAKSILSEAADDWEWIVVLHNTDNITVSGLRELVGNDDLLTVYEKKDDRHSPASPRNTGLEKARGEFVYFLDGDDTLEPGFIQNAVARMEADGSDIGIGRVRVVHNDKNSMYVPLPLLFPFAEGGYTVKNDREERGKLLYGAPMMVSSKMIRRSLLVDNQITFDEDIELTEDVIFMLKCCVKAQKINVYKDLTAYSYIQSEGSLLQNMILRDDSDEDIYLRPLRQIVSLCLENNFSPGAYLWNMFGLFSRIYQNEAIDKDKRARLMAAIQEYLPLLSKNPPEGIGQSEKHNRLMTNLDDILTAAFSLSDEETFRKYFLRNVFYIPEKTCVEWRDPVSGRFKSMSYQELAKKATALGAYLYAEGASGKTVAAVGEKSIEWVILCVACFTYGITFLPIDQTYEASEIARRLSFCHTKIVFTDLSHRLKSNCPSDVKECCFEDIEECIGIGEQRIENGDAFAEHDLQIKEDDPALLIFTSGTGGKTKCAVLLEKNLTPERYLWTGIEMDRYPCLSMLPFCHVAGIKDIIGALITGTYVYVSLGTRYIIDDFLHVQPVCVTMVPLQAKFFAKFLDGKNAAQAREILGSRIKVLRLVGAPVSEGLRSLYAQWDIEIHSNYGLSETCGTVSCSYMKDGKIFSKPGSIGRVIDGVDVRIDQPDASGNGEIWLKGQIVFSGYLNNPEETDAIFCDGWLKTGDIGRIDEDRCLYIRGRKKNVIILPNGENVIPEEIERMIAEIPQIRECMVFEENQMLCASIVIENSYDYEVRKAAVQKAVQDLNRQLPFAIRLQKINITDVPLPKTISGKIKRNRKDEH